MNWNESIERASLLALLAGRKGGSQCVPNKRPRETPALPSSMGVFVTILIRYDAVPTLHSTQHNIRNIDRTTIKQAHAMQSSAAGDS